MLPVPDSLEDLPDVSDVDFEPLSGIPIPTLEIPEFPHDDFLAIEPSAPTQSMHRQTDLTPEVQERICTALRYGNTRKAAAQYGGISTSTLYNWLQRGRNPKLTTKGKVYKKDKPFVDFLDAVTRAENEAEMRNVGVLQKAATGWPVKKTTTTTTTRYVGKTDNGEPILVDEVTTRTEEYTEYSWRAAIEWLKRRNPEEWGNKPMPDKESSDTRAIAEEIRRVREQISDEEWKHMMLEEDPTYDPSTEPEDLTDSQEQEEKHVETKEPKGLLS